MKPQKPQDGDKNHSYYMCLTLAGSVVLDCYVKVLTLCFNSRINGVNNGGGGGGGQVVWVLCVNAM